MSQNKNESLEIKDLEVLIWALPGVIFLLYIFYSHKAGFLLTEPAVALDLFFAFSPVLFVILFSFIYNNFPISYLLSLLKKNKEGL